MLSVSLRLPLLAAACLLFPAAAVAKVDFNREIRPILSDKCFACHGFDEKERKAGLRLDVREAALQTAESGEIAIIPHQAEASELIRRVTTAVDDDHMPPANTGKKLTPLEIERLKQWIAEGAEYQAHWSFVPPVRPQIPEVKQTDWPRTGFDRPATVAGGNRRFFSRHIARCLRADGRPVAGITAVRRTDGGRLARCGTLCRHPRVSS
jgi:hypothetical protein